MNITAGATTYNLKNSAGFTSNDVVLLGNAGSDGSEIINVEAIVSPTSFSSINPCVLNHIQFDKVNALIGDTINIYRAANPAGSLTGYPPPDSTFGLIGQTPIEADKPTTTFTDADGDDTFWYKFTYFNSLTSAETNLYDSTTALGEDVGAYCSPDNIRQTAGMLNNEFITDADLIDKRQEAQDEIDAALAGTYTVPFTTPVPRMISGITRLLAAGKLLVDNFGPNDGPMSKDGESKIMEARIMLEKLDSKIFVLTDYKGNNLTLTTSLTARANPNPTTQYLPSWQGGSHRNFRMGDVQGYSDRKY